MNTEKECPSCGNTLIYKQWYDDYSLVEYVYKCSCGYKNGWAYGHDYEEFPINESEEN